MTRHPRVAITGVTALVLGASTYGNALDVSLPGALQYIWDGREWLIYGLAVAGVFFVYRWWALLPAIVPVAVTIFLHRVTGYVSPWHEDQAISLSPWFFLLVIAAVIAQAMFLAIGLLLRAAWEWARSAHRRNSLPKSA